MAVIRFRQLSMAEAEQCVAEIWTCLEEYNMPSPAIAFDFHGPLRTGIKMSIDDPVAASVMLARLSTWIETQIGPFSAHAGPQFRLEKQSNIAGGPGQASSLGFLMALSASSQSGYAGRFRRK